MKSILEELNDSVIESLSIDEIKTIIQPVITNLTKNTRIYDPGLFLYRARKIDSDFSKSKNIKMENIIYPPHEKAKLNRANRKGDPMFYCSLFKEPMFFELTNINEGDELVITFWKTQSKMLVNNIGYTQILFEKLGEKRKCPAWTIENAGNQYNIFLNDSLISSEEIELACTKDENRIVNEEISEAFMSHNYKLTAALAELHLGKINNFEHQFAGILYPSYRMKGDGDNLALLPDFVDNNLIFKKAVHVEIGKKTDNGISITYLDHADTWNGQGVLQWLGRLPHWVSAHPNQSVRAMATKGVDKDGDYTLSSDGVPCHWVVKDVISDELIFPS